MFWLWLALVVAAYFIGYFQGKARPRAREPLNPPHPIIESGLLDRQRADAWDEGYAEGESMNPGLGPVPNPELNPYRVVSDG